MPLADLSSLPQDLWWTALHNPEAWVKSMRPTLEPSVPANHGERVVRDDCSRLYESKAP